MEIPPAGSQGNPARPAIPIPQELIARLRHADKVAVLTGAGVSRESGVPTFREKQTGLWERYRAEDLVSVEGFQRDPALVWNWHVWMAHQMAEARPNPGHFAIAGMTARFLVFTLITQNIDGLHQRAGSPQACELHGNIHRVICSAEHTPMAGYPQGESPPRCPRCGAYLRHDVVWFGEPLPAEALELSFAAASDCDVFFSIGTSAVVQPAASLPFLALRNGATVVEVNPDETPLSDSADFRLPGRSGTMLPALAQAVWPDS